MNNFLTAADISAIVNQKANEISGNDIESLTKQQILDVISASMAATISKDIPAISDSVSNNVARQVLRRR